MKAVVFEKFGGPLTVERVAGPIAVEDGVVIKVEASGICRSDWHGWLGHDPDITKLPHVPGHEMAKMGQFGSVGITVIDRF
jgi:alcohol dehydrogenase